MVTCLAHGRVARMCHGACSVIGPQGRRRTNGRQWYERVGLTCRAESADYNEAARSSAQLPAPLFGRTGV